ncbi:hypothetical protein EDC62_1746 [Tibeticola sediminis]|uniref:Uncharacterized protein n=1 Tax=Tibeticola sediminis TaxID=1917811 RepID=A0A3N4V186_9BURK|nr:hypothetical protein [Tibeticola sediminis]RPE66674.1 hypothetical protein EDC62_1746 [Tibeticola sediminis]
MPRLPLPRRGFLSLLLAAAASAHAANPTVEIIAFAHPPVLNALQPLRDWLGQQGKRVRWIETDMESPAGAQRLRALGITSHTPLVILVDGRYAHTRADGSTLALIGFPSSGGGPGWTIEDAKAIITRAIAGTHPASP